MKKNIQIVVVDKFYDRHSFSRRIVEMTIGNPRCFDSFWPSRGATDLDIIAKFCPVVFDSKTSRSLFRKKKKIKIIKIKIRGEKKEITKKSMSEHFSGINVTVQHILSLISDQNYKTFVFFFAPFGNFLVFLQIFVV